MPTDDSAEYYTRRRLESVAMSQAASNPAVQKIHLELARRYADLAALSDAERENDGYGRRQVRGNKWARQRS